MSHPERMEEECLYPVFMSIWVSLLMETFMHLVSSSSDSSFQILLPSFFLSEFSFQILPSEFFLVLSSESSFQILYSDSSLQIPASEFYIRTFEL